MTFLPETLQVPRAPVGGRIAFRPGRAGEFPEACAGLQGPSRVPDGDCYAAAATARARPPPLLLRLTALEIQPFHEKLHVPIRPRSAVTSHIHLRPHRAANVGWLVAGFDEGELDKW